MELGEAVADRLAHLGVDDAVAVEVERQGVDHAVAGGVGRGDDLRGIQVDGAVRAGHLAVDVVFAGVGVGHLARIGGLLGSRGRSRCRGRGSGGIGGGGTIGGAGAMPVHEGVDLFLAGQRGVQDGVVGGVELDGIHLAVAVDVRDDGVDVAVLVQVQHDLIDLAVAVEVGGGHDVGGGLLQHLVEADAQAGLGGGGRGILGGRGRLARVLVHGVLVHVLIRLLVRVLVLVGGAVVVSGHDVVPLGARVARLAFRVGRRCDAPGGAECSRPSEIIHELFFRGDPYDCGDPPKRRPPRRKSA